MKGRFILHSLIPEASFLEAVEIINTDQTFRNDLFTAEYLAGQYAYYQATSRDLLSKAVFKDELGFLLEVGAKFKFEEAMRFCGYFKKMLDNDYSIVVWK